MLQKIFSFSLRQDDTGGLETVKKVKEICKKSGTSFSFVIVKALKEWLANKEILEQAND